MKTSGTRMTRISRSRTASPLKSRASSVFIRVIRDIRVPILLLALVGATSCTTKPTQQGGLHVLAAETWLADIAQNVAGQRLHVDSLLVPGIDPHEYQPAPQDAIKIAQSNLLIVNGLDYETWLSASLDAAGGQRQLVVASNGLQPSQEPQGAADPHMWMNPLNVVRYVQNIRDGLIQADPQGKEVYTANAEAYIAKLQQLDASIKSQVAQVPPARRLLVTNHDSLGYFASAYGFAVLGAVVPSVTNEASPSAQQMASLINTLKRTGAPAIFLDVSENQNLAKQIASATGAQVVTSLYVETLSAPDGPASTYLAMMLHDSGVITQALIGHSELQVLAAETWLADIAQNVAGQRLHVDSLLVPGIDPHRYQPSPRDTARIAQANTLIINGNGYETWLEQSLQDIGPSATVITTFSGPTLAPYYGDPAAMHMTEPESDPHAWMNVLRVRRYVQQIRDALSQLDPAGRDIYIANAVAYIQKLNALDASIKVQVAQIPPEQRLLVTNHDALSYYADAYGFTLVGVVIPSVTDAASPSTTHMAALIDTIKRTGARAIFLDVSENPSLAKQIASATGAQVVTSLYLETLSTPDGPAPTYIAMLQHDTAAIVEALK